MLSKVSALTLPAMISVGAAMLGTPSFAGERSSLSVGFGVDSDYPWFSRSGPDLYYSYHYDHVPAYPAPIYRTDQPVVVYRQPQVRYRSGASHIDWCNRRYRSYRIHDNTFQPYRGARMECWSPYS